MGKSFLQKFFVKSSLPAKKRFFKTSYSCFKNALCQKGGKLGSTLYSKEAFVNIDFFCLLPFIKNKVKKILKDTLINCQYVCSIRHCEGVVRRNPYPTSSLAHTDVATLLHFQKSLFNQHFLKNPLKIFSKVVMFFALFFVFGSKLVAQNFGERAKAGDALDFWVAEDNETLAQKLVLAMTDEELFAQCLMFGWAGAEPGPLLQRWVERGLGSVKVFGWNTDDLKIVAKTVKNLQSAATSTRFSIPLFVATDQEGGWVRHVKGETSVTPGNMAIGSSALPLDAFYSAFYINREIKALGINMNFSPTVDLFTNPASSIIGTRSFGRDEDKVSELCVSYSRGVAAAGVIPTAKHFPGHGDTRLDSHVSFPLIDIDEKTFQTRELAPFKALIKDGVSAVMSAHLGFPNVDPTRPLPPASLSPYILTKVLRKDLGFSGIVITDDMRMNGVTNFAVLSKAYRLAILAGNDILLSSNCAALNEPLWTSNIAFMKSNNEFKDKVTQAAYKVILEKLRYFKNKDIECAPLSPDPNTLHLHIPDPQGAPFFFSQACRSIVSYKSGTIPLKKDNAGQVLLVGNIDEFFTEGKKIFPDAKEFRYNYELGPIESLWMSEHIGSVASTCDTVLICVSSDRTLAIAEALKGLKKRVVIFSLLTPQFALKTSGWVDTILVGYSYSPYTIRALYGALTGAFKPKGKLPF